MWRLAPRCPGPRDDAAVRIGLFGVPRDRAGRLRHGRQERELVELARHDFSAAPSDRRDPPFVRLEVGAPAGLGLYRDDRDRRGNPQTDGARPPRRPDKKSTTRAIAAAEDADRAKPPRTS